MRSTEQDRGRTMTPFPLKDRAVTPSDPKIRVNP
jgi:hypothetical protein